MPLLRLISVLFVAVALAGCGKAASNPGPLTPGEGMKPENVPTGYMQTYKASQNPDAGPDAPGDMLAKPERDAGEDE